MQFCKIEYIDICLFQFLGLKYFTYVTRREWHDIGSHESKVLHMNSFITNQLDEQVLVQKVMELLWKLSHYDQKYLIVVFFYSPTHEEIESWGESFDKLMQSKGIFKY